MPPQERVYPCQVLWSCQITCQITSSMLRGEPAATWPAHGAHPRALKNLEVEQINWKYDQHSHCVCLSAALEP
eukprot:358287-Chlamydomonas_euryale.AAC.13